MYEHAAVDWVLEEEKGLYYVTEQVRYSYTLGQRRNSVVLYRGILHFAGPE